jgi:hypothetical protein
MRVLLIAAVLGINAVYAQNFDPRLDRQPSATADGLFTDALDRLCKSAIQRLGLTGQHPCEAVGLRQNESIASNKELRADAWCGCAIALSGRSLETLTPSSISLVLLEV